MSQEKRSKIFFSLFFSGNGLFFVPSEQDGQCKAQGTRFVQKDNFPYKQADQISGL